MAVSLLLVSCSRKTTETDYGQWKLVTQKGGQSLGYSPNSGVKLIKSGGYFFKDLNRNGKLDAYEDWRKPVDERAKDLASQLSKEEIAGLMLYSAHQAVPSDTISEAQKKFLTEDNVRHVLVTSVGSSEIAAKWSNNVQALVEGLGHGIPANNSSDPRHSVKENAEYSAGAGGTISQWPSSLGMAATFDPGLMERFGEIASKEYRALGIATALSPQIDISGEPRWARVNGTFGEDPKLSADMARAYCDGFQTSKDSAEIKDGWGYESVNAMVKHWPGGGAGEGGRDAHYGYGKYAVYPGNNLDKSIFVFTEGAFKLNGPTKSAASVMPYYTISYGQDPSGANVGNSYSKYIITDLLRDKYGYDGVVCTDWMITADEKNVDTFTGKCWGVENLSVAERHYRVLMAGVDQFGGNNDKGPVLEAYKMGVNEFGEEAMRKRFEQSAVRILRNIFRCGLFENPYLVPEKSAQIVGCPEYMKAGYDAQLKSVVMLKNHGKVLPLKKGLKVYVPKKYYPGQEGFFGGSSKPAHTDYPVDTAALGKYFTVVEKPESADAALVFIAGAHSGTGYDSVDRAKGGNGYVPISLQYNDYTAVNARDTSIAGGDPYETFINRSYKGKTVRTPNKTDLDMVLDARKAMGKKPVIVELDLSNPVVPSEFEPSSDAILVGFGVSKQAIFDIISGAAEPSALLPIQMPVDMSTVEKQFEDTPRDMKCYVDADGNTYDFAFGMNWRGVISDTRVAKYK